MVNLVSVNAHCKAFFTSSLYPEYPQYLLDDAICISSFCLYPLSLLGKILGCDTSNFLIKDRNIIPLKKLSPVAIPMRVYFYAVILLIPGVVIAATIRGVSLVASPRFREQYWSIVSYYLPQQQIVKPSDDPWKDPFTRLGSDLSLVDINCLAKVNKVWYWRAKFIFLEKVGQYLEQHDPDLTFSRLHYSINHASPCSVTFVWDSEKILKLPSVEFQFDKSLDSMYQRLKKHKIMRTADFSIVLVHAFCQEAGKEGVLFIRNSKTIFGKKTAIYWNSNPEKKNTTPGYLFFTHPSVCIFVDLIDGKDIKLIHHLSGTPLTFKMINS